jgi:TonB family protein
MLPTLNANHRSKPLMAGRAFAGITFVTLIALAAAMALFSRDGVAEAKRPGAQDQKSVATAPAKFENLPDIPLVITDAQLSLGELRVIANNPYGERSNPDLGVTARDVKFAVNVVNRSDRRVTECIAQIQYATSLDKKPVTASSDRFFRFSLSGKQVISDSSEIFRFETKIPLQDNKGDLDLMNLPYDFNIRITGVKFESDEEWLMAEPGKTPSTRRERRDGGIGRRVGNYIEYYIANQDHGATDSIQPMSDSLRPAILYREKAQYTQGAKDNNVEGKVILSVVFGVNGKLGDINVVQGAPFGLTENAIAAAKKIRFDPAVKDGRPVSVRGALEFTFGLYKDAAIYPMTVSLRPTILYREKARYTQEAKDNRIAGTVVLSVVFGVDSQLRDIKVVRGLPDGLTEKAIEAAKKIRFSPAKADGQSVAVRGTLEFAFNPDF